eukprot:s34_g7.t1
MLVLRLEATLPAADAPVAGTSQSLRRRDYTAFLLMPMHGGYGGAKFHPPPPKSDNTHDPHGHLLSQNKVCGYTLKPGEPRLVYFEEQRCCELPKDDCHKCCVSRTFDAVEGEPSPDTCRRTCIRMCYKGKLERFGRPPDHFPRCPDDPDAVVSLYPKSDKDEKLKDKVQIDPEVPDGRDEKDLQVRALIHSVQEKITDLMPKNSENQIFRNRRQLPFPPSAALLTSVVGATLAPLSLEERQQLLETPGIKQQLELVLDFLQRESQAMKMSTEISESIQRSRDHEMRLATLHRQSQEIQRELQKIHQRKERGASSDSEGQSQSEDEEEDEVAHLSEKLQKAGLPEDAMRIAKKELRRLKSLQAHHPEYTSTHSYLELLSSLPWKNSSEGSFDLADARRMLDEDHRGLEKVKVRILEFLAVQKMRGRNQARNWKGLKLFFCFKMYSAIQSIDLFCTLKQSAG